MLLIFPEAKTKSVPLQCLRFACSAFLLLKLAKTKQQQQQQKANIYLLVSDSLNQKLINFFDNIPPKLV